METMPKLAKLHGEEEILYLDVNSHSASKTKAIPNQAAELGASHGNSPKESHLCRKFKTSSIKFSMNQAGEAIQKHTK